MACPHAEGGDRPEMSPPRERKVGAGTDTSRKFSWATQRIHDLTKELEAVQARLKVGPGGASPGICERETKKQRTHFPRHEITHQTAFCPPAAAQDHDRLVKDLNAKLQRATADCASTKEHRDALQVSALIASLAGSRELTPPNQRKHSFLGDSPSLTVLLNYCLLSLPTGFPPLSSDFRATEQLLNYYLVYADLQASLMSAEQLAQRSSADLTAATA